MSSAAGNPVVCIPLYMYMYLLDYPIHVHTLHTYRTTLFMYTRVKLPLLSLVCNAHCHAFGCVNADIRVCFPNHKIFSLEWIQEYIMKREGEYIPQCSNAFRSS